MDKVTLDGPAASSHTFCLATSVLTANPKANTFWLANSSCRGTGRPDDAAADKADGLEEEERKKKGDTSGGKEPETPAEMLEFLRQFVDQG